MRYTILGAAIAVALFAVPATAADWVRVGTEDVVVDVNPGEIVCSSPSSNTDDTEIIKVNECENFDLFQHDDKDGSGSVSLVTGTGELCPSASPTSADNACAPIPGTSTLSGDDAIYGAGGIWMRVEAGGTNTNPTSTRWCIHCGR